jgi:hypothetical protein
VRAVREKHNKFILFERIDERFLLGRYELDDPRSGLEYVGSVEECDHDYWKKQRRLILINCNGDYFEVKNYGKKSLQEISDEFENRGS